MTAASWAADDEDRVRRRETEAIKDSRTELMRLNPGPGVPAVRGGTLDESTDIARGFSLFAADSDDDDDAESLELLLTDGIGVNRLRKARRLFCCCWPFR